VAHIDDVAVEHPVGVLLAALKAQHLATSNVETRERADFMAAHHEEY
jgi:hypothetical protein